MNTGDVIEHSLTGRNGAFRVIVREDTSPARSGPVCAAVFGEPADNCLVRIHSRCLYGEIFEAEDCDCRRQLQESIRMIQQEGAGIVIYLDQEGRGSGLVAKAKGYVYAEQMHVDTFSSYAALHLPADSRTYEAAAEMLKHLGLARIRLLTNNPHKIAGLEDHDIGVERVQLIVPVAKKARAYLMAKREHGHLLPASLRARVRMKSQQTVSKPSGAGEVPAPPVTTPAVT
jgi:GTP cyclohydrolase II